MLVRGTGLIWPVAFGVSSRRSALRGAALPYNRGVADLHYDGVYRRWRLNSFDVLETHDGLREDLDRFYAAANCTEILLRTHGAGGEALFDLAAQVLFCVSRARGRDVQACRAAFMWLFLNVEGLRPDLDFCGVCGGALGSGGGRVCLLGDGMMVDSGCAGGGAVGLPVAVIPWLRGVERCGMEGAMGSGFDVSVLDALAGVFVRVVEGLIERPLRTAGVLG